MLMLILMFNLMLNLIFSLLLNLMCNAMVNLMLNFVDFLEKWDFLVIFTHCVMDVVLSRLENSLLGPSPEKFFCDTRQFSRECIREKNFSLSFCTLRKKSFLESYWPFHKALFAHHKLWFSWFSNIRNA